MDNYKNFVDSIKEFSFDIIGYLIPGMITLVYLQFALDRGAINEFHDNLINENQYSTLWYLFSYIFGYVALGFSLIKNNLLILKDKYYNLFCNYQILTEEKIGKSNLFEHSLEKYNKESGNEVNLSVRELRTRIMSFIPEADNKIYSFRYRSDLCENTLMSAILLSTIFLLISISQLFLNLKIINNSPSYFILYMIAILISISLMKVRDRFYDISIRIPFSIFLAKKDLIEK